MNHTCKHGNPSPCDLCGHEDDEHDKTMAADIALEVAQLGINPEAGCNPDEVVGLIERLVAAERERWQSVVFDGWAVLKGLDESAAKRTTHQNVSDTLDALMRVIRGHNVRANRPSGAAQE